jgi:hypothetical protein
MTKPAVGADGEVEGAWGKATTNVDVSADRCLAYFWHHMTYESNAEFEKTNGKLMKMQVDVPGSHSTFMITSQKSPFPGVDSRVYAAKWAWRREEDGFVAGFTSKGTRPPLPPSTSPPFLLDPSSGVNKAVELAIKEDERAAGCTRGTLQGFYRFTPLAANVCRVTVVFQATAGGSIPVMAMNFGVKSVLASAEKIRDKYERNGMMVDAELRAEFPLPTRVSELSSSQKQVVKSCQRLEEASVNVIWSPLKSPSALVSMWSKPPESFEKGERKISLGKAECDVDVAAEDAQAWWFAYVRERNERWSARAQKKDRSNCTARASEGARERRSARAKERASKGARERRSAQTSASGRRDSLCLR